MLINIDGYRLGDTRVYIDANGFRRVRLVDGQFEADFLAQMRRDDPPCDDVVTGIRDSRLGSYLSQVRYLLRTLPSLSEFPKVLDTTFGKGWEATWVWTNPPNGKPRNGYVDYLNTLDLKSPRRNRFRHAQVEIHLERSRTFGTPHFMALTACFPLPRTEGRIEERHSITTPCNIDRELIVLNEHTEMTMSLYDQHQLSIEKSARSA